jgi:hypothetical protein
MELAKNNRLEVAVNEKLSGWEIEQAIAAIKCQKKGIVPTLVEYPTGLRRLRFIDNALLNSPFDGSPLQRTFEVSEELWEKIKAENYWLVY